MISFAGAGDSIDGPASNYWPIYYGVKETIGATEPFLFGSLAVSKTFVLGITGAAITVFLGIGFYIVLNEGENLLSKKKQEKKYGYNGALLFVSRWSSLATIPATITAITIAVGEKVGSGFLTKCATIKGGLITGVLPTAPIILVGILTLIALRALANFIECAYGWKNAKTDEEVKFYRERTVENALTFCAAVLAIFVILALFSIISMSNPVFMVIAGFTAAFMIATRVEHYFHCIANFFAKKPAGPGSGEQYNQEHQHLIPANDNTTNLKDEQETYKHLDDDHDKDNRTDITHTIE